MTWRAVHAGLDDLERDLAAHGLVLLGHVDDAHAAFADLLQQLVRPDDRAGPFAWDVIHCRALEKAAGVLIGTQQGIHTGATSGNSLPITSR